MKLGKKSLSLLLALLMVVSCVSVCFSPFTVGAVESNELKEAFAAISETSNFTTGDGTMLNAAELLYQWVQENVNLSSNAASNASNSTSSSSNYGKISVVATANNSTVNLNASADAIVGSAYAAVINTLLPTDGITDDGDATKVTGNYTGNKVTNSGLNTSKMSYKSAVDKDFTVTVSADLEKTLLAYNSVSDIPATILLSVTYTYEHGNKWGYNGYRSNSGRWNYKWEWETLSWQYLDNISRTVTSQNTQAYTDFNNFNNYFSAQNLNATVADLVNGYSSDELTALIAANNTAYAYLDAYSDAVKNNFFDMAKINTFMENCVEAKNVGVIVPYIDTAIKAMDDGYDENNLTQMTEIYATQTTNYNFLAANKGAVEYVVANFPGYDTFKLAEVEAWLNALDYDIEIYNLKQLVAKIDSDIATYSAWTIDDVDNGVISGADITTAIGVIQNDINALSQYSNAAIAEVCNKAYNTILTGLLNNLRYLASAAEYNVEFLAAYEKYRDDVVVNFDLDADSTTLMGIEEQYKSWYTGLRALIDEMVDYLGEENANKLFDELNEPMVAYMENAYSVLNARMTAEIDAAYDMYTSIKDEVGTEITLINVSLYGELKSTVGAIDTEVYSYLKSSAYNKLTAETVAKYDEMQNIIAAYNNFKENLGFDDIKTYEIADIIREENADEIAREGDYTVTDENVENVIDVLEAALKNEEVQMLLGELLAGDLAEGETAEPFDIGALLGGLIEDNLYSDDIINAIIQYVYPLVAKEFAKVWAGLPTSITVKDVDTGYGSADVTADTINIDKVEIATANLGMPIFPTTLGAAIQGKYPEVAAILTQATTAAKYDKATDTFTNPWEDEALFETELDEEGNVVLDEEGNPVKKYKLVWGVHDKESFIDAAVAALTGLEPLLAALLSNAGYETNAAVGTGEGSVKMWGWLPLDLEINPISLRFMCSANDGYDNVIAPLFEALGFSNTEIPHGETMTNTRAILENGLFDMIDKLIAKLSDNPLETILDLLPNLAYILEAGMIQDILSMLKTNITYEAIANYEVIGIVKGSMVAMDNYNDPVVINIGDMLDLGDLGLDLSSFGAIWSMITDLIGVELPALNGGILASMGTVVWNSTNRSEWLYTPAQSGKAAYIDANKADLLIYIVRYVLGNLGTLIDTTEADETIQTILANITTNPDDVIAAIVELLNQIKYDTLEEYTWYEGEVADGTVEGQTPATLVYLSGTNNWNKGVANEVEENLNSIVDTILDVAGADVDLSTLIGDALGGLFTNANITALAKLLSGLGTLSEPIPELINGLADIDLSVYAAYADLADEYNWGFTDGDRDAFVAQLIALLDPFAPVLDFILAGENLELIDGEVELIGYDGFNNAIVPILEALGATVPTEKTLAAIVDSLLGVVDTVIDDPINAVIDLLPGLLYFLQSNGLTTAVRNLLQPVYVILDTIRPIYALSLNDLLAETGVSLDKLDMEFVVELIEDLTGLNLWRLERAVADVCTVIATDYTSKSAFVGEAKKGAYSESFDRADMITVILSLVLEMLGDEGNAEVFDELLGTEDFTASLLSFFNGVEPTTQSVNWMYWFGEDHDFSDFDFDTGISIEPTINALEYPNNWTEDTAKYIDENLDDIEKTIVTLIDESYTSLGDLIADKLTIYSTANVKAIADLIQGLLKVNEETGLVEIAGLGLDAGLIDTVGAALNIDVDALMSYTAPEGIDTADEFADALSDLLATIPDLVAWLFFGKDIAFFTGTQTDDDGNYIYNDLITIKGSDGYKNGLALILEALGVEGLPEAPEAVNAETTDATVRAVLKATFARLDEILADPIDEALDLLPNLIYFINADGITASVRNVLSSVYALFEQIGLLGADLNLDELLTFDIAEGVTLSVTNLGAEEVFALAEGALGLDLSPVSDILGGLCVGKIAAYDSVGDEPAFKMGYNDVFARYDMITIIATVLLRAIEVEANEEPLKELMGEDIYSVILSFYDMIEVPMKDISYTNTDKADTGYVFSAIETSELYAGQKYGPLYTEEMAQYIADNFGEFVDNIIYLLGIQIGGKNVNGLTDLLNGLVGGGLYNSSNAQAIADALAGVVADLEGLANGAGKHIVAILKTALDVDLKAYETMTFEAFENDRAQFEAAIIKIAEPIYPLLKWLLADEDFEFFLDNDSNDLIVLKGAEGYAYGIIPLLEVLGCENIMTSDAYTAAVAADDSVLITSILPVILDRLDVILADPADELLEMLPNLIYFINSNGVDTVVKNTLNAVYAVLNAIEPIAKVDLYEIIGLDLEELTFEKLFDMLLDMIADATGYQFESLDASAVAELTVGTLVSYTSANGNPAYKMVYQSDAAAAEMVTVVMRLLITFIMHENNQEMLIGLLKDNFNMNADSEKYVRGLLDTIADLSVNTYLGMDKALATLYYLFYGVDIGVGELAGGMKDLNEKWQEALRELGKTDDGKEGSLGNALADFLDTYLEDVLTSEGVAPNGFIAFFQRIADWFNQIIEWIKGLFS